MTDRSAASQVFRFCWLALRPYFLLITLSASPLAASLSVSLIACSPSCLLLMVVCVLMCVRIHVRMSCVIYERMLSSWDFSSSVGTGGVRNSNRSFIFFSTGLGRVPQLFAWCRNWVPLYSNLSRCAKPGSFARYCCCGG
jgi:hypothetical protein